MKNSIVLTTLELAGFKNPTAIANIISYVPNPEVALEMLLGIHIPIVLNKDNRFRVYKFGSEKIYEITSIDELGAVVFYNEYKQNTKTVWYATKEDYNNKVYSFERMKDYYTSGEIPTTGYSKTEKSMKLDEFESSYSTILHIDSATARFEDWMNYGTPLFDYTEASA